LFLFQRLPLIPPTTVQEICYVTESHAKRREERAPQKRGPYIHRSFTQSIDIKSNGGSTAAKEATEVTVAKYDIEVSYCSSGGQKGLFPGRVRTAEDKRKKAE